jgi:hypothetical protein
MSNNIPRIINYKHIDFNKLEYYQPHKTPHNTRISNVAYRVKPNQAIPIYIETPKLKTPTGIFKLENKYFIDFEIDISNNDSSFYDFLVSFDEKNVSSCHFHSNDWFNHLIPYDVIEDYYKSPLKLQRGGNLPIFRVKLPTHHNKVLAEFYNNKREQIDMNKIEPGDEMICILEMTGLRFLSQQFIVDWELSKSKIMRSVDNVNKLPSGYLFSDDTTDITETQDPEPLTTHDNIECSSIINETFEKDNEMIMNEDIVNDNNIMEPLQTVNDEQNENIDINEEAITFNDEDEDDEDIFYDSEYELDNEEIEGVLKIDLSNNKNKNSIELMNENNENEIKIKIENEIKINEAKQKILEYQKMLEEQQKVLENIKI